MTSVDSESNEIVMAPEIGDFTASCTIADLCWLARSFDKSSESMPENSDSDEYSLESWDTGVPTWVSL